MPTLLAIALALFAALPAALIRVGALTPSVEVATLCYGLAVVGAAFAMAWGAEAAEHDIPRALALTVVALLAVFPEYAVDIIFAFKAGQDPAYAPFAAANMTGSNRLLLGLGWPMVSMVAWLARGQRVLHLGRDASLPLFFLGGATIYSFTIPLRSNVGLIDSLILISAFGAYAYLAAREETHEPDLVGPAATIGALSTRNRRLTIVGLFSFAFLAIGLSAEPFAEGLVRTGARLGIDEFLLVQWLAPLASEAPEFLVAALLAMRGKSGAALALLLSAKLNQWTLLIGSLPLAYSLGAGHFAGLPLDARQIAEILLTASQSLFGVAVLASLTFTLSEAALLAGLFTAQLVSGGALRAGLQDAEGGTSELLVFSVLYVVLSGVFLFRARKTVASTWRKLSARRAPASSA
jgi:cation:H+ antiporter